MTAAMSAQHVSEACFLPPCYQAFSPFGVGHPARRRSVITVLAAGAVHRCCEHFVGELSGAEH
jgi:hypothetical protein